MKGKRIKRKRAKSRTANVRKKEEGRNLTTDNNGKNKYRRGTSDATISSSLTLTFNPQTRPYSSFENNTGHTDGQTAKLHFSGWSSSRYTFF